MGCYSSRYDHYNEKVIRSQKNNHIKDHYSNNNYLERNNESNISLDSEIEDKINNVTKQNVNETKSDNNDVNLTKSFNKPKIYNELNENDINHNCSVAFKNHTLYLKDNMEKERCISKNSNKSYFIRYNIVIEFHFLVINNSHISNKYTLTVKLKEKEFKLNKFVDLSNINVISSNLIKDEKNDNVKNNGKNREAKVYHLINKNEKNNVEKILFEDIKLFSDELSLISFIVSNADSNIGQNTLPLLLIHRFKVDFEGYLSILLYDTKQNEPIGHLEIFLNIKPITNLIDKEFLTKKNNLISNIIENKLSVLNNSFNNKINFQTYYTNIINEYMIFRVLDLQHLLPELFYLKSDFIDFSEYIDYKYEISKIINDEKENFSDVDIKRYSPSFIYAFLYIINNYLYELSNNENNKITKNRENFEHKNEMIKIRVSHFILTFFKIFKEKQFFKILLTKLEKRVIASLFLFILRRYGGSYLNLKGIFLNEIDMVFGDLLHKDLDSNSFYNFIHSLILIMNSNFEICKSITNEKDSDISNFKNLLINDTKYFSKIISRIISLENEKQYSLETKDFVILDFIISFIKFSKSIYKLNYGVRYNYIDMILKLKYFLLNLMNIHMYDIHFHIKFTSLILKIIQDNEHLIDLFRFYTNYGVYIFSYAFNISFHGKKISSNSKNIMKILSLVRNSIEIYSIISKLQIEPKYTSFLELKLNSKKTIINFVKNSLIFVSFKTIRSKYLFYDCINIGKSRLKFLNNKSKITRLDFSNINESEFISSEECTISSEILVFCFKILNNLEYFDENFVLIPILIISHCIVEIEHDKNSKSKINDVFIIDKEITINILNEMKIFLEFNKMKIENKLKETIQFYFKPTKINMKVLNFEEEKSQNGYDFINMFTNTLNSIDESIDKLRK
jgi:hypothetical protein